MKTNKKILLLLLVINNVIFCEENSVYCISSYKSGPQNVYYLTGMGDRLFSYKDAAANQDNWAKPFKSLCEVYEAKGYKFYTSLPSLLDENFKKNIYRIFCHNVPSESWCQTLGEELLKKTIIIITEPKHVFPNNYNPESLKYFNKILTWDDTVIDSKKFFKYYFVQSSLAMIENIYPFNEKKMCTLIASNKNFSHENALYKARQEAIEFFESKHSDSFDFYGFGWNQSYRTYKGEILNKTEVLRKYKFCICYENISNQSGYITEKIFGVFIAGCVPIYWGAPNITNYIPENCFIDRRKFPDLASLYHYISTMTEEEYNKYLNSIKKFLESPNSEKFSVSNFVSTLIKISEL